MKFFTKKWVIVSLFIVNCVLGQVPTTISYQGYLTVPAGQPVGNGSYSIEFSIYNDSTAGTALWSETQNISVMDGIFHAQLGAVDTLDLPFNESYYLEMAINGGVPLSPRVEFTSSAYSMNAGSVRGENNIFPSDGYVGIGTTNPSHELTVHGDLRVTNQHRLLFGADISGEYIYNADGQTLRIHVGNEDRMHFANNGDVGIGTVTPVEKLHVDGTIYSSSGGFRFPDGTVQTTADTGSGSGGSNTLDQAYDQGGPGAGRTITADAGALEINGTDGALFTGSLYGGDIPAEGNGVRMMWYPSKAAFRAGSVDGDGSNYWNVDSIGFYTFATGYNTRATASLSVALGSNTNASGVSSIAAGTSSIARENYSTAIGYGANAIGISSVALGYLTTAQKDYSLAIGNGSYAGGISSVAMGHYGNAAGDYSFAMGFNPTAMGSYSISLGYLTNAQGNSSTALGYGTTANGIASTALGYNTDASGDYSTAMGLSTVSSGDYSTALGLGTIASGFASTAIGSNVSTSGIGSLVIGDNSTSSVLNRTQNHRFYARFSNGFYLYTNSNETVGSFLGAGSNSWGVISDSTKKENLKAIDGEEVLNKISQFKLSSWNYKGQDKTQYRHYGPMAQDFYNAFGHDGVGTIGNDTTIASADFDGINFIAIQALGNRTVKNEERIVKSEKRIIESNERWVSSDEKIVKSQQQIAAMQNEIDLLKSQLEALLQHYKNDAIPASFTSNVERHLLKNKEGANDETN